MVALGDCFRRLFHRTPTRASHRFNLFRLSRQASTVLSLPRRPFLIFSSSIFCLHLPVTPSFLGTNTGDLFRLLDPCARKRLLSIYPADYGSRYIWDSVPICQSPSPPYSSSLVTDHANSSLGILWWVYQRPMSIHDIRLRSSGGFLELRRDKFLLDR
jgi:hypothetical protein